MIKVLKIISLCACLITYSKTLAQITPDSLMKQCAPFEAGFSGGRDSYEIDEAEQNRVIALFQGNVFGYFGLEQYDSPLKRQVFTKTDSYRQKADSLKFYRNRFTKQLRCIDFPVGYFFGDEFQYNIKTKSFSYEIELSPTSPLSNNYLQFSNLCINKPSNFVIRNSRFQNTRVDIAKQRVDFKILSTNTALEIENAKQDIKLLYIFKISRIKPYIDNSLGLGFKLNYLMGDIDKVYLYNGESNKVYAVYSAPPAVSPNQKVVKNKPGTKKKQ